MNPFQSENESVADVSAELCCDWDKGQGTCRHEITFKFFFFLSSVAEMLHLYQFKQQQQQQQKSMLTLLRQQYHCLQAIFADNDHIFMLDCIRIELH